MSREGQVNAAIVMVLLLVPLWAWWVDEPFTLTLCTRVAILALAGVGLNIALGLGGLVSLGHAAFFGLGGYAMGIIASHAQSYTPLMESPFLIEGTKSMPIIWLVAMLVSALAALFIGALSLLHHDYTGLCADVLLLRCELAGVRWRGWTFYLRSKRLSRHQHPRPTAIYAAVLRSVGHRVVVL